MLTLLFLSLCPAQPDSTAERVLQFCADHVGKPVGGGECAHLADAALKAARARPRGKDRPNPGDYWWGKPSFGVEASAKGAGPKDQGNFSDLRPGDILQFRDTRFEDGRGGFKVCPHHTAIVKAVDAKTRAVTVYEQNYGGKRYVIESGYNLSELKTGWVRAFHPIGR